MCSPVLAVVGEEASTPAAGVWCTDEEKGCWGFDVHTQRLGVWTLERRALGLSLFSWCRGVLVLFGILAFHGLCLCAGDAQRKPTSEKVPPGQAAFRALTRNSQGRDAKEPPLITRPWRAEQERYAGFFVDRRR